LIIPKYWAEAKITTELKKRQLTIKRFGWSDHSLAEAQIHAETRIADAIEKIKTGQSIRRVDHKIAYNGSEGLPIREEIIHQQDDLIITRNSYGALCLNTPDVLFADIDLSDSVNPKLFFSVLFFFFVISMIVALIFKSWLLLGIGIFTSIAFSKPTSHIFFKIQNKLRGNPEQHTLKSIRHFSQQHPTWHLRVYRTPKGYRVLVMHQLFNPRGEEAQLLFTQLDADPTYVRMCKNQNCFRARISPKPWRIGIEALRLGVWPVKEERMIDREIWVNEYQTRAKKYASCKFIEQLGSQMTNAKAKRVQSIHDQYCNANINLEIA